MTLHSAVARRSCVAGVSRLERGQRFSAVLVLMASAAFSIKKRYLRAEGNNHPVWTPTATKLRIGDWCVNPASGQISRDGETARVEVRTMRTAAVPREHAGEVVSIDEFSPRSGRTSSWTPDYLPAVGIAPPSTGQRPQAAHVHRDSAATRVSDGGDGQSLGGSVHRTAGPSPCSDSEHPTLATTERRRPRAPQGRLQVGRRRGALLALVVASCSTARSRRTIAQASSTWHHWRHCSTATESIAVLPFST